MFRKLPPQGGDARQVAEVVNQMMDGKTNNTGTVTLRASQTTTTLNDLRIGVKSVILFMPTTANAAGALSGLYVSARGNQTATLTHASNAQTDKTFDYCVIG